jgi:hypothetical protein
MMSPIQKTKTKFQIFDYTQTAMPPKRAAAQANQPPPPIFEGLVFTFTTGIDSAVQKAVTDHAGKIVQSATKKVMIPCQDWRVHANINFRHS